MLYTLGFEHVGHLVNVHPRVGQIFFVGRHVDHHVGHLDAL